MSFGAVLNRRSALLVHAGLACLLAAIAIPATAQAVPTPPQILLTSGINEASELLVQTHQSVTRLPPGPNDKPTGYSVRVTVPVSLKGVTFLTPDTRPLTLEEVRKRIGKGSPVLVMSGGEKPSPVYRRLLAREAVILVFPGHAPKFEKPDWPVEKQSGDPDDRTP